MSLDTNFAESTREVEKIIELFRKYYLKTTINSKLLVDHILASRKAAVSLITKQYKKKLAKQRVKEQELINSIVEQRTFASNRIGNWYKYVSFRKKIKEILLKREKCYTIISSITDAKDFFLEILTGNGKSKKYQSEQCPILNVTAFYIPRADIHGLVVKVHFIADGLLILDPKFPTGSEDDYTFFNQINFKKIIKAENDEKEENKRMVSSMCSTMNSSYKPMKSISSLDSLQQLKYGLSSFNKKFQSMAYLNIQAKSILKQRPVKRVASIKKIAFGEVNYSY